MEMISPNPREAARDVTDADNPKLKPHAPALRDFDVSTFRFFDVSTQKPPKMRHAPTHARRASCKRPPKLFSPIVTFKNTSPRPIRTHAARRGQSDARRETALRIAAPPVYEEFFRHRLRDGFRCGPAAISAPPGRRPQVPQLSTFRRFDFSTFPPAAPTRTRHNRWHDPREACVTLCHLRFEALRSVCTAPETAILPVLRKFDETCPAHRRSYGEV